MYIYIVSFVAAIGGLLFGFDTGVISGAIPFISEYFSLNSVEEGFAASNLIIGCIIGASVAGVLSDLFGRKKILIAAAVFFIVSAFLSAIPRTYIELIIARFIGGLAVGAASVLSPVYIAEVAPAKIRGGLVSLNQLTIVAGILLTYFTNWLLVDIGPSNWRWMFAMEILPAGIFLVALMFIPESPRWLTARGRRDEALVVLDRIGGKEHAENELREIQNSLREEKGSIKELLQPGLRLILLTGILLGVFQSITGIDTIVYYTPTILLKAGYESASAALLGSIIMGAILLVFTFVAIFTVDKLGRKFLLLLGLTGMGISFLTTGYVFQSNTMGPLILIPITTYVGFFAMSMGPVVWVLLAEIFPNKIRGTAMAITTMILWASNFFVVQTFPWLIDRIAENTFYFYGGLCAAAFITIYFMVTETKGKTLEEIEKMWQR